jgi:DNA-binding beta-propeller fold protein YncE
MNAGRLVVVDLNTWKLVGEVGDLPRATGVLAVPAQHAIFVSSAGTHEVAIVDDHSLTVTTRVQGVRFPDGLAYAPETQKVFVSDEAGDAELVIDTRTRTRRSTIALGGEAGNTQYDSVSHCILVAVQTRNELVAIDPVREAIVARYALPGSDHPHGFVLDVPGRLAFVSSEESATLQVVDLRTMQVIGRHAVGSGPDVLAWDAAWRRLYVASEGGVLSTFIAEGRTLRSIGEYRAPRAHTVSVDPRTHQVFLALENVAGRPVLRVMIPGTTK